MSKMENLKKKKECDNMYLLHIGKDIVIDENEIIGIFDLEGLKKTKVGKEFLENIKDDLIKIEEKEKSLILVKKNEKIKGYISNILSVTLEKRCTEKLFS